MQAAHLLGAENMSLSYGAESLFDDITIGVNSGDRVGIVGRNGSGKSSLMQILSQEFYPDSGLVTTRNDLTVGYLGQADTLSDSGTLKEILFGDQEEYQWASDPKVRDIISGLLGGISLDRSVNGLSGGQRRRVSLAQLLIGQWDVLMLDEPTNHLDVEAIAWLAQHLKTRWRPQEGALLVVTHDRWFLDEVANQTWEVHREGIDHYAGGYAAYTLAKAERERRAATMESKRQQLMKKELAWLRRGAPARTSKPKFRIEAANNLIEDVPQLRDSLALTKVAVSRLGKDVIDIEDLSYWVKDPENGTKGDRLFDDVTIRLAPGERVGIIGLNGAGKTTLFDLFLKNIEPDQGYVKHGKTIKIGHLSQQTHELEEHLEKRVAELVNEDRKYMQVEGKEVDTSSLLESFGFTGSTLWTQIGDLSGGQRRRLQLFRILMSEPNVLFLDEPTNDLDIETLTVIEDYLDRWSGTLVVVSHDRYLLERISDRQLALIDGKALDVPRGVDEFFERRAASRDDNDKLTDGFEREEKLSSLESPPEIKASSLGSAQHRQYSKELARIERQLEKLRTQIDEQQENMAEPEVQRDYESLGEVQKQLAQYQDQQEELELRWLEIAEILG